MEFGSLSIVLINILFYGSLSENSLPDCRGVFENIQYKPFLVFDVCVASYLNSTLTSTMYKCDNINGYVVEVTYDGDNCEDQNVISSDTIGIFKTNEFVNCDSSHICHYAKTKSYVSDNCSANSNEWFEKIYPVDWCYSYVYGTSTEVTCNNDLITSTTFINDEMALVGDDIANCDFGSVYETIDIVRDGQCEFDEDHDHISDYPYYTEIKKCYTSKALQFVIVMPIIFVLLNVLFI